MKTQKISHLIIFVSLFGLCSCNSDNQQQEIVTQEDSWSIQSARFIHSDKSSHNFKDTTSIGPQSRIHVMFNREDEKQVFFQTQSSCYSNQPSFPQYLNHEKIKREQMTAVQLLPVSMFKPKGQNERIQCDFNVIAKNSKGSEKQYELKGLKIKNFSSYSNHNPMGFKDAKEPPTLFSNSAASYKINVPTDSYQTHLLCQTDYISLDSSPDLKLETFIQPILATMQSRQLCRIVSTTQDQVKKYVSPIFWLQKDLNKVRVSVKTHFSAEGGVRLNLTTRPIITFTIENTNDHPVYINFQQNSSHIKIQPISHLSSLARAWYQDNINAPIRWTFDLSKVVTQKGKNIFLKINARDSIGIEGYANINIQCSDQLIPKPGPPQAPGYAGKLCANQFALWGYAYDFLSLPKILQSRVSDIHSNQWELAYDLNSSFANKPFRGFSHWSPTNFKHKCTRWIGVNDYPNMQVSLPNGPHILKCRQL